MRLISVALFILAGMLLGFAIRDTWPDFMRRYWCSEHGTWVSHKQWPAHQSLPHLRIAETWNDYDEKP